MACDVVFLEDNEELRAITTALLEGELKVRCLGLATLAEMKSRASELLGAKIAILDINLGPGQPSGIEAYLWLKENRFPGKVVFLTGHAESHPLVIEATRTGVQVLPKPVKGETLFEIVRTAAC